MKREQHTAGASPPSDDFSRAYAAYAGAKARCSEARERVEDAQRRQVARIAALPESRRADMAEQEAIGDELGIAALGDALIAAVSEGQAVFLEMMRLPAPTPFALFLKLEALFDSTFDAASCEDELLRARILADAGSVSMLTAHAWIDRWRALGGDFGRILDAGRGMPGRPTRGMIVDLDHWKPTDRHHPKLPPHTWLTEQEHHAGGVRVLEGLLTLVPGLQDSVLAIVEPTIPAMEA